MWKVISDISFIPDNVEVDDLFQIGLLALWKAKQTYDEKPYKHAVSTHCYRAIRSAIITHLRKLNAKKRRSVVWEEGFCESFENNIIGSMLVDEIRSLIPEQEQADLFFDRHLGDFTLKELACKYSMTERQIRYRLEKICQFLQEELNWEVA